MQGGKGTLSAAHGLGSAPKPAALLVKPWMNTVCHEFKGKQCPWEAFFFLVVCCLLFRTECCCATGIKISLGLCSTCFLGLCAQKVVCEAATACSWVGFVFWGLFYVAACKLTAYFHVLCSVVSASCSIRKLQRGSFAVVQVTRCSAKPPGCLSFLVLANFCPAKCSSLTLPRWKTSLLGPLASQTPSCNRSPEGKHTWASTENKQKAFG